MIMEEKIWLYPELTPEERREVEQYVERHPSLKDALARMKLLDRVLDEGRSLTKHPPSDEALAFLAVMRDVDVGRLPDSSRASLRDLEARVETDPELRSKYALYRHRLQELESASDAEAQFQRLVNPERSGDPERPPIPGRARLRLPLLRRPLRLRRDLSTNGHPRGGYARRRVAKVVVSVAAMYLLLFAAGRITRPEAARLASFDSSELVIDGYEELRGTGGGTVSEEVRMYLEALEYLREAERSFLGLFPRYDVGRLDAAADLLRQILEGEAPESFLAGEARYVLARTYLARGDVEAARNALERVASSQGRHADAAGRLLDALK